MHKPPTTDVPAERLLSLQVVAVTLGVCVKTVRRMVEAGTLPVHRVGRLLRVSESALGSYIASTLK